MKKVLRLLFFLVLPLGLPACGEKAPEFVPPDAEESKIMSEGLAADLVKADSSDLYSRLDEGFNTVVSKPPEMQKVMEKMFAEYGQPQEYKLRTSQVAQRVDGPNIRPTRVFWYAVKTTKYPSGKYFLKVEIVKSLYGQHVDVSGFGFLTFEKTPSFLKER